MGLRDALVSHPQLVVKQEKNWGEILTSIEAQSRYQVCDPSGAVVAQVQERSGGFFSLASVSRYVFKGRRPFTLDLQSTDGSGLVLNRPWFWFFSSMEVTDAQGRPVGRIEQRFGFRRRFEVFDAQGVSRAWIVGPLFKPWTFEVHQGSDDGPELGRVEKKWSGLLKEVFTDADTFLVTLPRDETLAKLVLASALLIDFCYFENTETSSRGLKLLE